MREKSGRPGRFYVVLMTYWTQFGIRFKISAYSPTQQIYLALHLDIEDAHEVQNTLMIRTLSRKGELFVLSQLLKEVYGIPKLVVLFCVRHKLALWTGTELQIEGCCRHQAGNRLNPACGY